MPICKTGFADNSKPDMKNGNEKSHRMTIAEIARLAGVTKSTVSGVLNNNPKARISEGTAAKVREIISRYNYVPSPLARGLSSRATRQIGFLVSSSATLGLSNSSFSQIPAGVEQACAEHDYSCVVSRYDLSTVKQFVIPDKLRQPCVDALIVAGLLYDSSEVLATLGIPIGIVGSCCTTNSFFQISRDSAGTFADLLGQLAKLGHQRVFFPYFNVTERNELVDAAEKCNTLLPSPILPIYWEYHDDLDEFVRGAQLCDLLFSDSPYRKCTAILANDQICLGFLRRLKEVGKKVPSDISVISTNNTPVCEWNTQPVSACQTLSKEHGQILCNGLIEHLEGKVTAEQLRERLQAQHLVQPVVMRATSGPAPKQC